MQNRDIKKLAFFPYMGKAEFLQRVNRFVIQCLYKGRKIEAFLPNPGRLWELLLPGTLVYLQKSENLSRKLSYTALAVEREGYPVIINTHLTNHLAEFLIQNDLIPNLEGARVQRREFPWGKSRFDFLLKKEKKEILLEVKSCTLYGKNIAMFPDAVTQRGKKHLQELWELSKEGKEGAILFLTFSPTAKYFLPEYHTDPHFAHLLFQAKKELSILPVAIKFDKNLREISQVKFLKIPWWILERENKNQGVYLLIYHLPYRKSLIIGQMGLKEFRAGYYLYIGSAERNLQQRINRHLRERKKFFWHIDYFSLHAKLYKAIPIRTSAPLECDLAQAVKEISEWEIPGFGSSDCHCSSHLFGMPKNPLQNVEFISLLQYFKMDRLF